MNAEQRPLASRLAELPADDQKRLIGSIGVLFEKAINVRSPKQRPSGKAGLRAEKGYFRLLYLQSEFDMNIRSQSSGKDPAPSTDWSVLDDVLRNMKDIPELRVEFEGGLASLLTPLGVSLREDA